MISPKNKGIAILFLGTLMLYGCQTVSSAISDAAVSLSTKAPTQARTVLEAETATKLLEDSLDIYVTSGHADQAVLSELTTLVPAVHNALVKVENANRSGNSAAMAALMAGFNEALAAAEAYETSKGISK